MTKKNDIVAWRAFINGLHVEIDVPAQTVRLKGERIDVKDFRGKNIFAGEKITDEKKEIDELVSFLDFSVWIGEEDVRKQTTYETLPRVGVGTGSLNGQFVTVQVPLPGETFAHTEEIRSGKHPIAVYVAGREESDSSIFYKTSTPGILHVSLGVVNDEDVAWIRSDWLALKTVQKRLADADVKDRYSRWISRIGSMRAELVSMTGSDGGDVQHHLPMSGKSGIALNRETRTVALLEGDRRKSYSFDLLVAAGWNERTENDAGPSPGFFVTVRDAENPVWRIDADNVIGIRWIEIIKQAIAQGGATGT